MDDLFKRNLLSLRAAPAPQTFSDALFSNGFWRPKIQRKMPLLKAVVESEGFSEKKQVLESFERFAQEKTQGSGAFKADGAEVVVRPETEWNGINTYRDLNGLMAGLSVNCAQSQLLLSEKVPGQVKVIFVTETLLPWEEAHKDLKVGFINELIAGLPPKTAEFFERMISAMKLSPEEVILYPVDVSGKDLAMEIMTIAAFMRPEVVITLGAKATQKILKSNDRLSLIHGQFFKRTINESYNFQVVPLFHPSIIETNQNMKKTAWTDMQKIMRHLKKLT